MHTMTVDNRSCSIKLGQTILEVAQDHNIFIPSLCFLKGAEPTGACRICVVEVTGARNLVASCAAPAADGMEVRTDSPRVLKARRMYIELMLASGHHYCATCEASGDCRLQDLAYEYKVETVRFPESPARHPIEENELIARDFSRCIMCGRCVQACNEVQVNQAISFGYRGVNSKVVTAGDLPYSNSDCVFCGECLQVCPVGALIDKRSRFKGRHGELGRVRTTCPYCGVGCQLWLHTKAGRIIRVTGVENGAPNQGRLCVKGRFGYDFIYSPERLKTPLIRENGRFREADWDEALDLVADKFKEIAAHHGPDALAGVSCARSINEDSYQMQKLFRAVFKTNNIDHCART